MNKMKIKASTIMNQFQPMRQPQNAAVSGGDINIYEPQTMKPAVQKRMRVTTFLRDMLAPGFDTFPTKHVIFDFKKNRQRVAPLIAQGSNPINVRRDGFRTETYEAPFISLASPYDVDLLQSRMAGEAVFGGLTPEERALRMMQQDFAEMDDMIVRREEIMLAQMMQTGIVILDGYIDDAASVIRQDTLNYEIPNIINLSGTDVWSDSGSKKYEDLEQAVKLSRQAGYNPEIAILGEDAWKNMRADSDFMNQYMDVRRARFGSIDPSPNVMDGNGYTYIGRLTELGIDLYRYDAWYYDDDAQTLKPYIDPEKVVVSPRDVAEMLYGATTQIPEGSDSYVTIEAPRATKVTVNRETDTKKLIVKSRPIPQPYDVSAWSVIVTEEE